MVIAIAVNEVEMLAQAVSPEEPEGISAKSGC
jgi:hypothetical protein